MCTKWICGWGSIDILDRYSWSIHLINTQLAVHRHLSWHLLNTRLTSQLTGYQQSPRCWLMQKNWPTFGWLLTNCWSSANQVWIRMLIKYWSRCQSRLSNVFSTNDTSLVLCPATVVLSPPLLLNIYIYLEFTTPKGHCILVTTVHVKY